MTDHNEQYAQGEEAIIALLAVAVGVLEATYDKWS
jgi:hypothetical protein